MNDEHRTNGVNRDIEERIVETPINSDRRELSPVAIELSSIADRFKSLAECLYEITGDRDRVAYLALAAECLEIIDLLQDLRHDVRERALRE